MCGALTTPRGACAFIALHFEFRVVEVVRCNFLFRPVKCYECAALSKS